MELPSGYRLLEYIQSSGTQYIDTGVPVTSNLGIKASIRNLAWTGSDFCNFYGVHSYNVYFALSYVKGENSLLAEVILNAALKVTYISTSPVVPYNYEIEHNYRNSGNIVVNGINYGVSYSSHIANLTLYICADNLFGSADRFSCIQLKSFQITDGNTVVRNFVPCINPSGAVGLYDLVNGRFYGNAGSGSFVAGPVMGYGGPFGRALVGGTAYEISGGRTLVNGTAYSIDKGKALVGGTVYEIYEINSA